MRCDRFDSTQLDFVSKKIAHLQRNIGALSGQDTKSLITN